jgi:hypothetical protein
MTSHILFHLSELQYPTCLKLLVLSHAFTVTYLARQAVIQSELCLHEMYDGFHNLMKTVRIVKTGDSGGQIFL